MPISSSTYWADQPGVLLRADVEARAMAMGGVSFAGGMNAATVHAQPASMSGMPHAGAMLTRLHLPADIALEGLFYAQPLGQTTAASGGPSGDDGRWGLGLGLLRLASGPIPETGDDGGRAGTFSYTDGLFLLGLAYRPPGSVFSWGLTGKALLQQFDLEAGVERGTGVGIDLGVTYRLRPTFQLSAQWQNVGGLPVRWTTGTVERADPVGRLGFSWRGRGRSPLSDLVLAGEWNLSAEEWHGGLEYRLAETLALRAGLDRGEPTAGLGVAMGRVRLDYAFLTRVPVGSDPMESGYVMGTHAISVDVVF